MRAGERSLMLAALSDTITLLLPPTRVPPRGGITIFHGDTTHRSSLVYLRIASSEGLSVGYACTRQRRGQGTFAPAHGQVHDSFEVFVSPQPPKLHFAANLFAAHTSLLSCVSRRGIAMFVIRQTTLSLFPAFR